MFNFLIYMCFVSMTMDIALGRFINMPEVPDGFSLHNVLMTWEEANLQCQSKDAILASPINTELYNKISSLINSTRSTFYIGTKANGQPGQFVSLEGISIENMTVSSWQELDPWNGDCLTMSFDGAIRVVQCETRLPYICFNKQLTLNKTNCGPEQEGYKYDKLTGNCYKIGKTTTWDKASTICVTDGAHLAVIKNANEAQNINNMKDFNNTWLHIGLRQTGTGDWKSVNGQPVEQLYNVWDNTASKPVNADWKCGTLKKGGKLDDVFCNTFAYFICQKAPSD